MPNDFPKIGINVENKKTMSSNRYILLLEDLIFIQKKIRPIVQIDKIMNSALEQPDFSGSLSNEVTHVNSIVYRAFVVNGKEFQFIDTLRTNLQTGEIVSFKNGFGHKEGQESIEELRAKASFYYTIGSYRKAYEFYQKILIANPKDGDAAYRLGLMIYYQRHFNCTFVSKGNRKAKAIEYMNIAYANGKRAKAENVLTNWERGPAAL